MTDFYYGQSARRPSFWRRLFGLGRQEPYTVPSYPPPVFEEPEPEPEPAPEPPPPASRNLHLNLPSEKPELEFRCVLHIKFEPSGPGETADDLEALLKQDLYSTVREISARLALTEQEQLSYRITEQLMQRRTLHGARVTYWGRCVSVQAKPAELELVRSIQQRKLAWESERHENWILERRIRSFSRIFDDPKIATIWWFAQHQDRLEELPLKAQLFTELDRWFNPHRIPAASIREEDTEESETEPAQPEPIVLDEPHGMGGGVDEPPPDPAAATDGQLLDQFLLDADEAGQAAIGVVLSRLYRENGRHDLADRIQRYAQPPPYADSPEDAGYAQPSGEADPPGAKGPIAL